MPPLLLMRKLQRNVETILLNQKTLNQFLLKFSINRNII